MSNTEPQVTGDDISGIISLLQSVGTDQTAQPIGVPSGYHGPATPSFHAPGIGVHYSYDTGYRADPYVDGDEWGPAGSSPDVIAEIQQRMVGAGLLKGSYRIGVWDAPSRSGYRDLLEFANGLGVDDGTALKRYGEAQGETKEKRAPLVMEVSNPLDIKAALRDTLKEKLGQAGIDDKRLDAMVAAYQGSEKSYQQQQYDLGGEDGAGGTVVRPPDVTTFADQQAKKVDPTAYDAYKVLDKFSVLEKELTGQ